MDEIKILENKDSVTSPCITRLDHHSNQTNKEKQQQSKVTIWMVIAVLTTLLGSGLPAGYNIGVINTPQEIIRSWVRGTYLIESNYDLTETEEISLWALIVSIFVVGAVIGALSGSILADKGGRRLGLMANHVLCLVSAMMCVSCRYFASVNILLGGRFIAGLSAGLSTCLMPTYLSEIAPPSSRGVMGVILPMTMCLGVVLSQILGMESILGTEEYWPYLLGGFGATVVIALLLQPGLPQSPTYCYIILRDEVLGKKALEHLRGGFSKNVEEEESSLKALVKKNETESSSSWNILKMVRDKEYRMPLLICVIFNAGQQLSGVNAVFYYSTMIFYSAGLTIYESQMASIGAGFINWAMSMVAIPLIRYSRRRVLLLTSISLCILAHLVLTVSLNITGQVPAASYIAIGALLVYVLVYHLGVGPIPYMIATELFPSGPRSVALSVGGTCNWLTNLIVSFTFPLLQSFLGVYSFTVFIGCCVLFWIFTYRYLPETLNKKEQQDVLNSCNKDEIDNNREMNEKEIPSNQC